MMKILNYLFFSFIFFPGTGQSQDLFFREDWKETPAEIPVTQDHLANPDLILKLFGPGGDNVKKSNHPDVPNDPFYIWSGECKGNWALSLRHRSRFVDLTGNARILWRSKQSGFRQLRLIILLRDGTWLVSDQYDASSNDWREKEFRVAEMKWRKLDIERVTEGGAVENPDLSKVEEIGFTDLMSGGQTPASSRVDWIAVYGKGQPRSTGSR
jgi:hypothetical protein